MKIDSYSLLALIPLLPLLGAAINLLFGRHLSRRAVHFVAIGSVLASFVAVVVTIAGWPEANPSGDGSYLNGLWHHYKVYLASLGGAVPDGKFAGLSYTAWTWMEIDSLKIDLAFRFDTLTAVMCCLITFVGSLIHIYSKGYMAKEPRYAAYFGYLNLFTAAMLILVLGDNLPVMFIGWEGVGLCSYLLIGFSYEKTSSANAGRKAFIVNRIGDFAFILGVCLLFFATGALDFPTLKSDAALGALRENASWLGGERVATAAAILLFIGACGKSAQIPLYVWLPDAMAGPTPVSALIHAATMVTSGIYMVARLSFVFSTSVTAMAVVAGVGALTALLAAFMAFAQTDFKKVLAYSTVSQLGFMFVGVGTGAWAAGIFHVLTHGFFKAGLFLGAGSVMHAMSGSGDITKMGGLRKHLRRTHWPFLIFCLAIAGIFPFSGFFSKDEILAGAWHSHPGQFADPAVAWWPMYGKILWVTLSVAAVGTAFYMFRLYALTFLGECRADEETQKKIHESPTSMTGPLAVLALCTLFLGIVGWPHFEAGTTLAFMHNHIGDFLGAAVAPQAYVATGEVGLVAGTIEHLHNNELLNLMAIALVLGAAGSLAAYMLYRNGFPESIRRFTSGEAGAKLFELSKNKLYVDEFYEKWILSPFRKTCRVLFLGADRGIIDDFIVTGTARIVDGAGKAVRRVQNGNVHRYLAFVVVSAAVVFFMSRRTAIDFDYETKEGSIVVLHADVKGATGANAEIGWDFTGDGKADEVGSEVEYDFAGPGEYMVTLLVVDGVYHRESSVTHQVVVPADEKPAAGGGSND